MAHPFIGKKVVVRAPGSGVFIGTLVKHSTKRGAVLEKAQRIWSWQGALETLHLAAEGPRLAKISPVVESVVIPDAREIIQMSDTAEARFSVLEVYRG